MADYCFYCGNRGTPEGCVKCGRKLGEINSEVMSPKEKVEAEKKYREILIPDFYMDKEWSSDIFWKTNTAPKSTALSRYVGQLSALHDIFKSGAIPNKSAFIIAPQGFSKCTFAYSCMKHALQNGHMVAPMIDTLDLKRLFTASTTKPDYKLYHSLSMDDYIPAGVVFVTVAKSRLHYDAFLTIADLIEKRLRFNKPTFVISEFSLEEISRWDNSGNYKNILTATEIANQLKLPVIIEYKGVNTSDNKDFGS